MSNDGRIGDAKVIDVKNPQSPQIVGNGDTPGEAHGAAVLGTHTYVADIGSGLQILPLQCSHVMGSSH